jgi:hypothetical protein
METALMASYSKQLVEIAREWLAVNPDASSPFLRVPGLGKDPAPSRGDQAQQIVRAKNAPAPLVNRLKTLVEERKQALADFHAAEGQLERLINSAPEPGQRKSDADDRYRADLGRWCLAWARDGHNVFDLSSDFTAAMLLTDARELDIATVRLPFRGLLMLIPDGFARGTEGGHYTKIHITEIPRQDVRNLDVGSELVGALDNLKARGLSDASIHAALLEAGQRASASDAPKRLVTPVEDPGDTVLHIYASDGVHILDTLIERKGLTWEAFDDLPDAVEDDADRHARHTIRQIVFGALAYASAVERSVELRPTTGKRRVAETAPRISDVGRTIKIDPNLVRSVRAGSREVALRLKHRWITRGHYRNQPHGIRRSERKTIWIMPFWKGPEEGAALVHTYKMESDTP